MVRIREVLRWESIVSQVKKAATKSPSQKVREWKTHDRGSEDEASTWKIDCRMADILHSIRKYRLFLEIGSNL